uniref:MCPH1 protein n=1 Tax=Fopius arisanus TaxID=64838 RepID=A0A0C9QSV8_9HYME
MYSKNRRRDYTNARRSSLQVNLSFVSNSSDTSDTEVKNINDKQEILDDNMRKLREAILHKTRELFDNQNVLCKKTATVLGGLEDDQNDQNDQNQSNSQEKNERVSLVLGENDSNDCLPKSSIISEKGPSGSPVVSSSNKKFTSVIFSPRKTRSSHLANKDGIIMEKPIKSSTFITDNSTAISCPEIGTSNLECITPKSSKPVIRDVTTCHVSLDKIDGYERINRTRNLKEIPMELTPTVGNPMPVTKISAEAMNPLEKLLQRNNESLRSIRASLEVRTSVDPLVNDSAMSQSRSRQLVFKERNSISKRKSLSLSKSDSSVKIIHPALSESSTSGRDRLSMDVNTSLGSRRSINVSVVESTPYPVTRSMLMKTHSRLITLSEKKSTDSPETLKNSITSKSLNPEPVPSPLSPRLEDTIVLATPHPLKGPIIKDSDESEVESDNPRQRESPLEDSSDDERSEKEDNVSPRKKQCKRRKLFTQLNNSGLVSLSPMERAEPSPKPKTPVIEGKRRRKIPKILIHKNTQKEGTDTEKTEVIKHRVTLPKPEKKTKKRKITSKKIVIKKKLNPDVVRLLKEVEGEALDNSEHSRDSLNDFTDSKRVATKGRHHTKRIYIVTTGLCNGDKDLVKAAVKKIGGARIETSVTRQTTHIITTGVRTINLLRGIIRGCWLVSILWLKKSIEARNWQSPERYEIDHFSKAVQENRRDREIFGRSYVPELFATCGLIYIDSSTTPPPEILKELIKTAGGTVIESPRKAKIIVGSKGLREIWILDSITTGELQPLDDYRRH